MGLRDQIREELEDMLRREARDAYGRTIRRHAWVQCLVTGRRERVWPTVDGSEVLSYTGRMWAHLVSLFVGPLRDSGMP